MNSGPLASLRVLDLGGAESDGVGRLFADLGADVLKIEPPGGSPARGEAPTVAGASVRFALQNANKRSAVLDPSDPADRERLIELAGAADIVVDSGNPGAAAAFGTSCVALSQRFGHLVTLSITDFGTSGPRAGWQATDAVLYALSTALSRTGPTTGTPVLPPIGLASATAAAQAAWAALAAYYRRLQDGTGDYIDFARFEGVLQSLDPPYGSEGQAAAGVKKARELWRGRPRNQQIYPIFGCRDGYVRICLLSPRQWQAMFGWLGEPEQFADPKFATIAARYAASRELNALIAQLCEDKSRDELVTEGQARGVPIAAVLTPQETLSSNHFREVGALTSAELAPGVDVVVPSGPFIVDGSHTGLTRPAPAPGVDEAGWAGDTARAQSGAGPVSRPFEGVRILDLGVIVAGGELGRLFADLGAEVIKIESAAYPDGLRQTPPGMTMSRSWALTHRNEYSLGLDLRHPDGAEVFARLVAESDAVFANFKPGTLASLGFSYDRLKEFNPAVVLAESSAFGATGPWSAQMGYGPLVRATTGVTWLWTSPDAGPGEFYDATTIFPDHVSARITAIAALAALVQRRATGSGAHVHISQAEAAVNQLATAYVTEAARAAGLPVAGDTAEHGVYPCAGDDEWCVISIRSDEDRNALAAVVGDTDLASWTAARDKTDVANTLQQAGIAAAPMNRAVDVLDDPQVRFRDTYTDMVHPLFDAAMPTETRPAPYTNIAPTELRPAPMPGEHTREICQKVLGLTAEDIDRLIAQGALFAHQGRP
ncbi:CoA transferase [Mycolicibacterium pulveris]|uniref:Putative CoA-transferase n=1 Tax=Mycolicibacterium pulveris TaxID=36813 RepID=A0A7I7UQA9_MYCPV|nr:CoA transferase [Mycolicibacterium pulveris]MCV6983697.1 CoA transferase [Mycolicibacterium pulveris]BBY83578.1 putative CoA-transferase [Mycolicibacterium pulveris]